MGKIADFRFGKAGLQQGAADMECTGGCASGSIITSVVCVGAIHNDPETMLFGVGSQLAVGFFLAKETAVGCVCQVFGIRCFVGFNQDMLCTYLPGNLPGFEPFRGWQAGRDGCHGKDLIAKNIVGHLENQAAVGTAGKGHQDTTHTGQDFLEFLIFFVWHCNFLRVCNYQ